MLTYLSTYIVLFLNEHRCGSSPLPIYLHIIKTSLNLPSMAYVGFYVHILPWSAIYTTLLPCFSSLLCFAYIHSSNTMQESLLSIYLTYTYWLMHAFSLFLTMILLVGWWLSIWRCLMTDSSGTALLLLLFNDPCGASYDQIQSKGQVLVSSQATGSSIYRGDKKKMFGH